MENLDIIILSIVVAIAFVVFTATTLKEFSYMDKHPYGEKSKRDKS